MVIVRILRSVCGRGGFGRGRARADVMMSLQRAVCVVGQHKLVKEKTNRKSPSGGEVKTYDDRTIQPDFFSTEAFQWRVGGP